MPKGIKELFYFYQVRYAPQRLVIPANDTSISQFVRLEYF